MGTTDDNESLIIWMTNIYTMTYKKYGQALIFMTFSMCGRVIFHDWFAEVDE